MYLKDSTKLVNVDLVEKFTLFEDRDWDLLMAWASSGPTAFIIPKGKGVSFLNKLASLIELNHNKVYSVDEICSTL